MRRCFADLIHAEMSTDRRIVLLTADMGYKMWDRVRADFPDRAFNVGAAEQLLLGAGVGLALDDFIPILYSITPFLLSRPFEWIRNYLHHEGVAVKLVGSGRDRDYLKDGYTHWAEEDLIKGFSIKRYMPETTDDLRAELNDFLYNGLPCFLSLKR